MHAGVSAEVRDLTKRARAAVASTTAVIMLTLHFTSTYTLDQRQSGTRNATNTREAERLWPQRVE